MVAPVFTPETMQTSSMHLWFIWRDVGVSGARKSRANPILDRSGIQAKANDVHPAMRSANLHIPAFANKQVWRLEVAVHDRGVVCV